MSPPSKEKIRPYGRSLADFLPLSEGENNLLATCRLGTLCRLSDATASITAFETIVSNSAFIKEAKAFALAGGAYRPAIPSGDNIRSDLVENFVDGLQNFVGTFRCTKSQTPSSGDIGRFLDAYKDKFAQEVAGWRSVVRYTDKTTIRGSFLRFLLLGGDDENPVHEHGVQVSGGHIIPGDENAEPLLDLEGSTIPFAVRIEGCVMEGTVSFAGATTRSICFQGTRIDVLNIRDITLNGDLQITYGFNCYGSVEASNAKISGTINCAGASLINPSGKTLVADSAKIGGSVLLTNGFTSVGQLRFADTQIAGQIALSGGFFGLNEILSDRRVHSRPRLKFVLDFRNLQAKTMFFGPDLPSSEDPAIVQGSLNFVAARIENFIYDPNSIPAKSVVSDIGTMADCTVTLDGFRYEHIGVPARSDLAASDLVASMLVLIRRQPSRHLDLEFRSQPFEQLAKSLAGMGRDQEAKKVARAKASGLRRQEWILLNEKFARRIDISNKTFLSLFVYPLIFLIALILLLKASLVLTLKWLIFNQFLGAGHRHMPTYTAFFLLLFGCGWFYQEASGTPGAFVPVDKTFSRTESNLIACGQRSAGEPVDWVKCSGQSVPEMVRFRPYIYSLDLMLQIGPFGQKKSWEPTSDDRIYIQFTLPFYGHVGLPSIIIWYITVLQAFFAIVLYILILRMLNIQIRDK